MDRFIGKTYNVNPLWLTDLKSNMDRFIVLNNQSQADYLNI